MHTITTKTKYGGQASSDKNPVARDGFKIEAEVSVTDAQRDTLAQLGLASLLYRGGASVCNTALNVKKNSEIEFTDERAAKLSVALGKWAEDAKDNPLGAPFELTTVITRHVHGEASGDGAAILKEAKDLVLLHESKKNDLEAWLTSRGYSGETHGEDNEYLPAMLTHVSGLIREYKRKQAELAKKEREDAV